MKVGDKVEILFLYDKKDNRYGTITSKNGDCIMVKPKYHRHEIEMYSSEVRLVTKEEFKNFNKNDS